MLYYKVFRSRFNKGKINWHIEITSKLDLVKDLKFLILALSLQQGSTVDVCVSLRVDSAVLIH